jgi:putative oxidoreductase
VNYKIDTSFTTTQESKMKTIENYTALAGRLLISFMFLFSGISKVSGYTATQGYMAAMGVSGSLLPWVIALEIIGSIAIIIGFKTRITAFLLAGFTLLAAYFFHNNSADQIQSILFMKNVAIAGGFLFLVANGAGSISVDRWLEKRK